MTGEAGRIPSLPRRGRDRRAGAAAAMPPWAPAPLPGVDVDEPNSPAISISGSKNLNLNFILLLERINSFCFQNKYIVTISELTNPLAFSPFSGLCSGMDKKPEPAVDIDMHSSLVAPQPGTAGRVWRERLHAALEKHEGLTPEVILDRLLSQLPDDPIGVFKAITATLPKELDVQTAPQQMHLTMLRVVAQAKARGIDLGALLEDAPLAVFVDSSTVPEKEQPKQLETKPQPKPTIDLSTLDFLR